MGTSPMESFRLKFSSPLQAEQHTRRDAYLGVQRSSGPLKQLAGKQVSKLDNLNAFF